MIYSDRMIRDCIGRSHLDIFPWNEEQLQPASYDVCLDFRFRVFNDRAEVIDPHSSEVLTREVIVKEGNYLVLHPGEFVLGSTIEDFVFGPDVCGQLGGKSSLARMGLQVHATAGWIDPGFTGQLTLELSNVARLPIRLYPTDRIGQVVFIQMSESVEKPYGHPDLHSKYGGAQSGPVESRYHLNEW